jgi:hypothetical protein
MTIYQESGLIITLPDDEHFRFQDCQAYKGLSGANLKEMDFAWWQNETKTLWLIEIKEYANLSSEECLPDYLLDNLVNKATDSLLMLAAMWSKTNQGLKLAACLPPIFHRFSGRLKLFLYSKLIILLLKIKSVF